MIGAGIGVSNDFRSISKTVGSPLGTGTIFTFYGGIEIVRVTGLVTTVIQAQATTAKLSITADALAAVDICATLDINGFAAGSLLEITGTAADAMVGTTAVGVIAPSTQVNPVTAVCVASGVITATFGAASTGAIRWDLVWRPISGNARVV